MVQTWQVPVTRPSAIGDALTRELIPVVYTCWRYGQLRRAQRTGRPHAEIAGIDLGTGDES